MTLVASNPGDKCVDEPLWKNGRFSIKGYDGKDYTLFEGTWKLKLAREERAHVKYNFHKIVETLQCPDEVRKSKHPKAPTCFIAYKKFGSYYVRPNITAPNPPGLEVFAVVADSKSKKIKTFYPCRVSKEGEKLWPLK